MRKPFFVLDAQFNVWRAFLKFCKRKIYPKLVTENFVNEDPLTNSIVLARAPSYSKLHVLDSTDPAQIRAVENKVDLWKTLFVVTSKSGLTLEPNIFNQNFFERARQVLGRDPGDRFIAITDPGSKMISVADFSLGHIPNGRRYSSRKARIAWQ